MGKGKEMKLCKEKEISTVRDRGTGNFFPMAQDGILGAFTY